MRINLRDKVFKLLILAIGLLSACTEDEPSEVLVKGIIVTGASIEDGGTSQMNAAITPTEASNQTITWSVSREDIASISETGLLTAIANGNVTVMAEATDESGVSGTRLIAVSGVFVPPVLVEAIVISGEDITDGTSKQFSATVAPANATNQELTWSVSDVSIAEIDQSGKLTPKFNGSVTVSVAAQDASSVVETLQVNISGVDETIDGIIVDTSADILDAIANATAGDVIYVRSGNYAFGERIQMNRNGLDGNLISLLAYPNDVRPVFDFSSMTENSSNRGVTLSGEFWHIKGIDFYKAGDNGMFISGHNNLIEFCYFYENADTGLQIGNGASNNTVLNCDSYYNADSSIENADGFACKLDAGSGNKFIGCRAWQNLDDGWDGYLRGNDNITTYYENCWAINNGILKDGSVGGGDGNGFKTGGSDDKLLKHNAIFSNCIAAGNTVDGFDHNSNRGDVTMLNCASHSNGRNINFGSGNIANSLTIKNTVSLGGGSNDSFNATTTDISNNSWLDNLEATSDDFESLSIDLLLSPRQADGSLPAIDYMKLVSGSDLIDKGIDVGLSFQGTAPDVGVFESTD